MNAHLYMRIFLVKKMRKKQKVVNKQVDSARLLQCEEGGRDWGKNSAIS